MHKLSFCPPLESSLGALSALWRSLCPCPNATVAADARLLNWLSWNISVPTREILLPVLPKLQVSSASTQRCWVLRGENLSMHIK